METKAVRLLSKVVPADDGGCGDRSSCPAVMEDENGNFIVIGKKPLENIDLNGFACIAEDEQVVLIPRELFLMATKEIR